MSTRLKETANAANIFFYHALADGLWLELDTDGNCDTVTGLQMGANWLYDRNELIHGTAAYYNAMRYYPMPTSENKE